MAIEIEKCEIKDINKVYQKYGKAAYHANCFEIEARRLILFMNILKTPTLSNEEMQKVDTQLSKKNLGTLIDEIKKYSSLGKDLKANLDNFRVKRNYLIHQFFNEHAYEFLTLNGRELMLKELAEINSLLIEADTILSAMSKSLRNAMGISERKLEQVSNIILTKNTGIEFIE